MKRILRKGVAAILAMGMLISSLPVFAQNNERAVEENVTLSSMLDLEEKEAAIVLNGYSEEQLRSMPLSEVLAKLQDNDGNYIEIDKDAKVVWAHFKDEEGNVIRDEYHELDRNETVDLSAFSYTTGYTMELIIGSDNQLDIGNIRYIIRVYVSDVISEEKKYQLYTQSDDGTRTKIIPEKVMTEDISIFEGMDTKATVFVMPEHERGNEYYLGISSLASKHPNVDVEVYTFEQWQKWILGISDESITDSILNQDMTQIDSGYKCNLDFFTTEIDALDNMFISVYKDKNGNLYMQNIDVIAVSNDLNYIDSDLYSYENDKLVDPSCLKVEALDDFELDADGTNKPVFSDLVDGRYYMLKEGYSIDDEYYVVLKTYGTGFGNGTNTNIIKAVEGKFNTLEEAEAQEDIKEQLFPSDPNSVPRGYKANYNYLNGGKTFTVFFKDGTVYLFNVKIVSYDPKYDTNKIVDFDNAPIIGQEDPYFGITGVKQDGKELETYILKNGGKYNLDTYYGFGNQTVFILDKEGNADLSRLTPEFRVMGEDLLNVYEGAASGGELQESGVNVKDFSKGALSYSAVWKDDTNKVRNYKVNVVKSEKGKSKLYVNGPDKREIFLDDYFERKHDIFIANIGDKELKNLKVELIDAENVKLDDYWTVGGENNDTLAPFSVASTSSEYSELPNVAKIRLLPDGDNTGEVKGTLRITSDGGERTIELSGQAGNPEIVTKKLSHAVKFVPYQKLVMTNNMHEWNEVSFELVDGKLPDGVELYPTGEIYGTPKESGTFKIKLRANYSRETFESSEAELTLVVDENTDMNVDAQTDDDYKIEIRIPDEITGEEDVIFKIERDYDANEFQDLWIDGVKAVEGIDNDYTVGKGSTNICLAAKTVSKLSNGSHTIAAEYRNKNNEVKKAAQNTKKVQKNNNNNTKPNNNTSRGGGSSLPSSYKVWFEVNGGTWLKELTVARGTAAQLPTPEREGYVFDGWYTDKALTKPYKADTKVNSTTTLYAKWKEKLKLWFEVNGGTWLAEKELISGEKAGTLPTPERWGYIFEGWYTDEALTAKFDPDKELTETTVLYAKWKEDKAPEKVYEFEDVNENDWFYSYVDWAYAQKLMVGVSNQLFAPNESITGGMVVTVLARLSGDDVTQYTDKSYDDVFEDQWYTPYAKWAKANGLVDGIPFNPPEEISREMMGVIIARFVDYMETKYELSDEEIVFADADKISENAKESMQKLYKLKIFEGKGEMVIDPLSYTTRAEFATLMQRTAALIK